MKRVISLWFPHFATDRLQQQAKRSRPHKATNGQAPGSSSESPLATVAAVHGGQRIAAANGAARAEGISPGMALADARALDPSLTVCQMTPEEDLATLNLLTQTARRYTPWVAVDPQGDKDRPGFNWLGGDAGLWLDVSGCTHLFGGEKALLADITDRFEKAGFAVRTALAPTPGAAWALARFSETDCPILMPGRERNTLAPLPVAALRIPGTTVEDLERVGLRRIGDLMQMPLGPLARRFGQTVLKRLDQALGRSDEPISPGVESPLIHARRVFTEPIGRTKDIETGLTGLLAEVVDKLKTTGKGVRRLDLSLFRVDSAAEQVRIGTMRPVRDGIHLARLFRDKMEDFDAGFGVEVMALVATETVLLPPQQGTLTLELSKNKTNYLSFKDFEVSTARLVDRLAGRMGSARITRLRPHASHIPEHASHEIPILRVEKERLTLPDIPENRDLWHGPARRGPRPIRLLAEPITIEVMAPVPDGPPVLFSWRQRQYQVASAEGPERIAPEWWQGRNRLPPGATTLEHGIRDYYRIEDKSGKRYWLYREGLYRPDRLPRWYLHGFFV